MKVLFFDTETNGLPLSRNAPEHLFDNWPRIVSLAWTVCNVYVDRIEVCKKQYFIAKPSNGIQWNAGSAAIHGITFERATIEGNEIEEILNLFAIDASSASVIVSHNLAFDKPVILSEFRRLGRSLEWWPFIEYCTMESTKALCRLPSKCKNPRASDPYKFPKLTELHSYLFGKSDGFEFHSAAEDVRCLIKCFEELVFRRVVPLETWLARLVLSPNPLS
jgi:DNA polymerase-3 subunit alpha